MSRLSDLPLAVELDQAEFGWCFIVKRGGGKTTAVQTLLRDLHRDGLRRAVVVDPIGGLRYASHTSWASCVHPMSVVEDTSTVWNRLSADQADVHFNTPLAVSDTVLAAIGCWLPVRGIAVIVRAMAYPWSDPRCVVVLDNCFPDYRLSSSWIKQACRDRRQQRELQPVRFAMTSSYSSDLPKAFLSAVDWICVARESQAPVLRHMFDSLFSKACDGSFERFASLMRDTFATDHQPGQWLALHRPTQRLYWLPVFDPVGGVVLQPLLRLADRDDDDSNGAVGPRASDA